MRLSSYCPSSPRDSISSIKYKYIFNATFIRENRDSSHPTHRSSVTAGMMSSWDDICINPHQTEIDSGREEGQIAGLQAGFNDGFALGRTKGIEFGMELGFMRGFLNTVESKLLNERLQKKVEELRQAIDNFPSLDAIKTMNKEETYVQEDASETVVAPGSLDILGSMQRIRAKFKVLTVLLKVPQFSLKAVMNRMESGETHNKHNNTDAPQGVSSEW